MRKTNEIHEIVGSYRRGAKDSGDIDILIKSKVFTLKEFVKLLKDGKKPSTLWSTFSIIKKFLVKDDGVDSGRFLIAYLKFQNKDHGTACMLELQNQLYFCSATASKDSVPRGHHEILKRSTKHWR